MDDSGDQELRRLREARLREMEKESRQMAIPLTVEVTDENFSEVVKEHSSLLIDFWAEWCGPCQTVGPVVEALASEFAGRVVIGKCDIDQNEALARRLFISVIPTLIFFSNGQMVDRLVGAHPEMVIRSHMKRSFPDSG